LRTGNRRGNEDDQDRERRPHTLPTSNISASRGAVSEFFVMSIACASLHEPG
jgi:hypothetical protein